MNASASSPAPSTTAPGSDASLATRIHLGLVVLIVAGLFVQVYLAGRGAFGAGSYDAHESFGNALHGLSLLLLISAAVGPQTRNRQDLGMAAVLFVLFTIQVLIGNRDHPDLAAFHPVNALLLVGLAFAILGRTRRRLAGR